MTRADGRRSIAVRAGLCVLVPVLAAASAARAADFRTTAEAGTLLYDAPSVKARPLFVLGRDVPLEVIVPVEAWIKVRDAGGTIGWVEKRALTDRHTLVVRVPIADVRATPDEAAPVVFRAEQNV